MVLDPETMVVINQMGTSSLEEMETLAETMDQ
jgi:hypothetical protein